MPRRTPNKTLTRIQPALAMSAHFRVGGRSLYVRISTVSKTPIVAMTAHHAQRGTSPTDRSLAHRQRQEAAPVGAGIIAGVAVQPKPPVPSLAADSERWRTVGSVERMAMGNRPEVKTAPAPIVALDVTLLAQQLATALARVPFRHPFRGQSSPWSNLGIVGHP